MFGSTLSTSWALLGKCWAYIEEARRTCPDASEELRDTARQLQLAVAMVGQAANKISYARRVAALAAVPEVRDYKTAETFVKTNSETFKGGSDDLFGEKFHKAVKVDSKACEKIQAAFEAKAQSSRKKKGSRGRRNKENRGPFPKGQGSSTNGPNNYRRHSSGGYTHQPRNYYHSNGSNFTKPYNSNKNGWRSFANFSRGSKGKLTSETPDPSKGVSQGSPIHFEVVSRNSDTRGPTSRGENPFFPEELADPDKRQVNPGHCESLEDSSDISSCPVSYSKRDSTSGPRSRSSGPRDREHAPERSHQKISLGDRTVCEQHLRETKEGWTLPSYNQSQRVEPACPVCTLQNGVTAEREAPSKEGGLHDQDRPLRRLLERRDSPSVPETDEVFVERELVPVPGPGLWPWTGPSCLYQAPESANSLPEETQHPDHNLSGRHVDYREQPRGSLASSRHCDYPFAKVGPNNKLGQIFFDSIAQLRVSRNDSVKPKHDHLSSQRKSTGADRDLSLIDEEEKNISEGVGQDHRQAVCHNSSDLHSSCATESPPASPDRGAEEGPLLREQHSLEQGGSIRPEVVETKPLAPARKPHAPGPPRVVLVLRRINNGMGSSHGRWAVHRRGLVSKGARAPHKHFGANGSGDCYKDISPRKDGQLSSHRNRQYDSPVLPSKEGRYKKQEAKSPGKEKLGLFVRTQSLNHSKLDPLSAQQISRREIKGETKLQRMDAKSQPVPAGMCIPRIPNDRLLRLKDNEAAEPVYEPGSGPTLRVSQRNVPRLEGRVSVPLSPFLPNRSSPEKAKTPADPPGNSDCAGVARTGLVSSAAGTMHRDSKKTPSLPKDVVEPIRRATPLGNKPKPDSGGISGYRDRLKSMGLSEKVIHLVINARRGSTTEAYSSPWNRWSSWCYQQHLDPYSAPVEQCEEYLADLFSQGLAPRTIGVHRSAISAYHSKVEGYKVGEHPLISTIIKGAGILRPPQPRYCIIWDVEDVLDFLRSQDTETIGLPLLTWKTAMLTALAAASRGGEIKLLRTDLMGKSDNKITFFL